MIMSEYAIRVENLGKRYRIGALQQSRYRYKSLRDNLTEFTATIVKRIISGGSVRRSTEEFWALQNVNFEVRHGEVIGIIGRNGAGKSTLLKVLSRITKPTTGRVELFGRVGSLLEVGTGFHPELTGRENVYLNGAILGMRKYEIDRKFDEIVEFAEIQQFLDTPVKRYSSGMHVRLAFAVAAHLEPEILLVDEVLAVGDAQFQKKCLGKMSDVAKEGRTVLFVSHNMGAITRLCQRSILLVQGVTRFDGNSDTAVLKYMQGLASDSSRRTRFLENPNLPIFIRGVAISATGKNEIEPFDINDELCVDIDYSVRSDIRGTNISFALKRDGILLFRSWDVDMNQKLLKLRNKGEYTTRLILPKGLFTPGIYSVYVAVGQPGVGAITQHDDCVTFEIENLSDDASHSSYSRGGLLKMPLHWNTTNIRES